METASAILVFVLAIFVWPILTGILFFIFTGFPILVLTKLFDIVGKLITSITSKICIVPFLGRLLRICISTVVCFTLIGLVTVGVAIPLIFIALMFVNGEASEKTIECDGWLVDFYCNNFKWLANICNCKHVISSSMPMDIDENVLLLMNKSIIESIPMSIAVMVPWYSNIIIFKIMFLNWCKD